MKHVVIVGGGFAGLNAAKILGGRRDVRVTLVDRQNYYLFQPLLYQVAMAGLSPADIATPIRSVLARCRNISVLQGSVEGVDLHAQAVSADFGRLEFDYLLLCCGSMPSYFGHGDWEEHAPSLKTIPQATEIRRRLLSAFEAAERTDDLETRRKLLTCVVIGGGPTGVELAGAIGEMSRFTLARDFRHIDTRLTRVILIESGPRILSMFSEQQAARAARDLEKLGVQVWPNTLATDIDEHGVQAGPERIQSSTVLWAAGVRGAEVAVSGSVRGDEQDGQHGPQGEDDRETDGGGIETDRGGRVVVNEALSIPGHSNVFVAGDQACFTWHDRRAASRHGAGGDPAGQVRGTDDLPRSRGPASGGLPVRRPGPDGDHRTQPRRRGNRQAQVLRLVRVGHVAGRPRLLPGGLQEPIARRAALGLVLRDVPARRPTDRRARVAVRQTRRA